MDKNLIIGRLVFFLSAVVWLNADEARAQFYQRQYAVVIGINEYQYSQWPALNYARNDAKGVAKLMEQLGFEVHLLFDDQATRARIVSLLEDDLAPRLKKEDAILFFFAGHGTTRRLGGKDYGYIVPSDATDKYASLISMDELRSLSDKMGNAKHQAFIMDCCYGGLLTTRNVKILASHPNFLQVVSQRQARQILTAGGKDQVVADGGSGGHSVFTGYLIKGIGEGLADSNGDHWITFNELVTYMLPAASSAIQTPGYATLPGHEQGEFLFPTLKISTSGSVVMPDSTGIIRQSPGLGLVDITGNWQSEKSNEYSDDVYFKFEQRGAKVLGKIIYPRAIRKILNGKMDGDKVSFEAKLNQDSYYYEGEISGDEIHFLEKNQDGALVEFSAKRIIDLTESLLQNSKLELISGHYYYLYSLDGHQGGVKSLAFGPTDGTWPTGGIRLASAGAEDGLVKNWDLAVAGSWGSERIFFSDQTEGYGIVVYSSQITEGAVNLLALGVARNRQELMFRNWRYVETNSTGGGSGKEIQGAVTQAAISQNLKQTVTAESEENKKWTITLRYSDGDSLRAFICQGVVHALAFSGDGNLLASAEGAGSANTMIKLWDTRSGALKRQIDVKQLIGVLAFNPGDSLLIAGSAADDRMMIWQVASGQLKLTLSEGRPEGISALTCDTGNLLASGGISADIIQLWDLSTGKLHQTLNHDGPVGALAFSQDGRLLASGDAQKGTIKIWTRAK